MTADGWSIQTSAGKLFALTVSTFLVVSGAGLSLAYFVIMANELDEELIEVLAPLRPQLERSSGEAEEVERLLAATAVDGGETPMAWRIVTARGREVVGLGPPGLLDGLRSDERSRRDMEVWRPTFSTRRTAVEIGEGRWAHVVLDGSEWLGRTRIFAGSLAAVAVLGSLLSLVVGRWFGRRVSSLVARVATEVAHVDETVELESARAPDVAAEVRDVAVAIEARLLANRSEIERSRILVAGLAHDLRAPVQALLTSTQVALLEGASLDPRETLGRHLSELRGLVRTVDNIMEWGAPRHGDGSEAFVSFDLGTEVQERLRGEEEAAARAGVFLDRIERGDLRCVGSPDALVLAIRNLVGNAIAWCRQGGEVSLILEGGPEEILVVVEDDGPGLDESEIEGLFEPFVRGKAAPGRRAGYGLGLAIVAAVARRHGGNVEGSNRASSDQEPAGARFQLSLPRQSLSA